MVIEERLLQLPNAASPISVTEFGITTESTPHLKNARAGIVITFSPIINLVIGQG
jgi:hypothetical protein